MMNYNYCTLFDSNYLDKGLVMIESLIRFDPSIRIYVLSMDEKCYEVLFDICLQLDDSKNSLKVGSQIIPIHLSEFESYDDRYKEVRSSRPWAQYCWTCSSGFIDYLLNKKNLDNCTYIDADMFFYSNPNVLVEELIESHKTVLVTEHGFSNEISNLKRADVVGRFCVEFNTFLNDDAALQVLHDWKEKSLASCELGDGNWGDQFYLDEWPNKYSCVHILKNKGAGVAPWNIDRYKLIGNNPHVEYGIDSHTATVSENIMLRIDRKECVQLVFYHFESISYIDEKHVDIRTCVQHSHFDLKLIHLLYDSYLKKIDDKKNWLKSNYGLYPFIKSHPALEEDEDNKKSLVGMSFFEKLKNGFSKYGILYVPFIISNHFNKKMHHKFDLIEIK